MDTKPFFSSRFSQRPGSNALTRRRPQRRKGVSKLTRLAYAEIDRLEDRKLFSTMLSASDNPGGLWQPITFSVTETGFPVPTGTVTFNDGTNTLATETLSSGAANFSTSSLAPGSHSIVAIYSGDTYHAANSSSPFTETITAPSIGSRPASVGVPYALSLNDNGAVDVSDWTVNWGDGTATIPDVITTSVDQPTLNHTYNANGSEGISASVTSTTGSEFDMSGTISVGFAPTITSMLVNGSTNPQRSMVTSLQVNFSSPVNISTGAFDSSTGAFTISQTASTESLSPTTDFNYTLTGSNGSSGSYSTYTLTFPSYTGASLPNGTYKLAVNPALVLDANGNEMENGQSFGFYRLFGDFNGSGGITSTNITSFNGAFQTSTGQMGYLDSANYDGNMSGIDAAAADAFGADLGVSYIPAASINTISGAQSGAPLTVALGASPFGNNADRLTYQWFVTDGTEAEVMLPGSYGTGQSGSDVLPGESLITAANGSTGTVVTTVPQLTFIPSGSAATWSVQVKVTDTDLNLVTNTSNQSFSVATAATNLLTTNASLLNGTGGGLQSLTYNSSTTLFSGAAGGLSFAETHLTSTGGYLGNSFTSYSFNSTSNTYSLSGSNYSSSIVYAQQPNELDLTITINNTAATGSNFYFAGFEIQLPALSNIASGPVSYMSLSSSYAQTNILNGSGSPIGTLGFGVQEQTPGYIGFYSAGGSANIPTFSTTSWFPPGGAPYLDSPLKPQDQAIYHLFLRVSPVANSPALGSDAIQALSTLVYKNTTTNALVPANEPELNWTDRRPVAMAFPTTGNGAIPGANPYTDTDLSADLLTYATSQISNALGEGAQGVVSWDIEGPLDDYLGDPELATTMMPGLNGPADTTDVEADISSGSIDSDYLDADYESQTVVKEYFDMFLNAGLETGVTLRIDQPQVFVGANDYGTDRTADTPTPVSYAYSVKDDAAELIGKIEYARQNWGCTLFYIDSDSEMLGVEPTVLAAVHAAEPGVLLIPETIANNSVGVGLTNGVTAAYANAAAYVDPRSYITTDSVAEIAYPNAFGIARTDLGSSGTSYNYATGSMSTLIPTIVRGDSFFDQGQASSGTSSGSVLDAEQYLALNDSNSVTNYNNDTITLSVETPESGEAMDVFSRDGLTIYSVQTATISSSLFVSFGGVNDTLVVDFSAGDPIPHGLSFNGGSSTNNLEIIDGAHSATITVGSGNVTLGYRFTSESLSFSNANLVVDPKTVGTDKLNVSGGTVAFPAQPAGSGIFVRNFYSIKINSGATLKVLDSVSHSDRQLLRVTNTFTDSGTLDLSGNDMDIVGGSLSTITGLVGTGFHGGQWQGSTGIDSHLAAIDPSRVTALGVIKNNQSGAALFSSASLASLFDGFAPGASDVLIKYTYYGDANLSGTVDGTDESQLDNGYSNSLTGWYNGDFDYSGSINGSDYTVYDNGLDLQGSPL